MTNTQLRLISGFFMIALLGLAISMGPITTSVMCLCILVLFNHEIISNFFNISRKSIQYFLYQAMSVILFSYVLTIGNEHTASVLALAIMFHFAQIGFLFFLDDQRSNKLLLRNYSFGLIICFSFSFVSLTSIVQLSEWVSYLFILATLNFSSDTAAWFWGKNFGKRKLWEKVSPNKTIEGAIGGAISSGIISSLLWINLIGGFKLSYFFIFVALAALSQIGDLVQSKFKRTFNIKDSSNLIPGHGGVYDRIDSLLFLAPFYLTIIKWI